MTDRPRIAPTRNGPRILRDLEVICPEPAALAATGAGQDPVTVLPLAFKRYRRMVAAGAVEDDALGHVSGMGFC